MALVSVQPEEHNIIFGYESRVKTLDHMNNCYDKAVTMLNSGMHKDALEGFLNVITTSRTLVLSKEPKLVVKARIGVIRVKLLCGQFLECGDLLSVGYNIDVENFETDSIEMVEVLTIRGDYAYAVGNYKLARKEYDQALAVLNKLPDCLFTALVDVIFGLSKVDMQEGLHEGIHEKFLWLSKKVSEKTTDTSISMSWISFLSYKAWWLAHLRKYGEAYLIYEECLLLIHEEQEGQLHHPSAVALLCEMSLLCIETGDFSGAVFLADSSLALCVQLFSDRHINVSHALEAKSRALCGLGKFSEAEIAINNCIAIRRIHFGGNMHPLMACAYCTLAEVLRGKGEPIQARKELQSAHSIFGQVYVVKSIDKDHLDAVDEVSADSGLEVVHNNRDVANCFTSIGLTLLSIGRYNQAFEALQASLAMHDSISDGLRYAIDADKARAALGIATVLRVQGKYRPAWLLLKDASVLIFSELGEKSIEAANCLHTLGELMSDVARYDDANTLLARSFSTWIPKVGLEHPRVLKSVYAAAENLRRVGYFSDAVSLMRNSQYEMLSLYGPRSLGSADHLLLHGRILCDLGYPLPAEKMLMVVVALIKEKVGENNALFVDALVALAGCLRLKGEYKNGRNVLRQAMVIAKGLYGKDSIVYCNILSMLSQILLAEGKIVEYKVLLCRNVLPLAEMYYGPNHPFAIYLEGLYDIISHKEVESPLKELLETPVASVDGSRANANAPNADDNLDKENDSAVREEAVIACLAELYEDSALHPDHPWVRTLGGYQSLPGPLPQRSNMIEQSWEQLWALGDDLYFDLCADEMGNALQQKRLDLCNATGDDISYQRTKDLFDILKTYQAEAPAIQVAETQLALAKQSAAMNESPLFSRGVFGLVVPPINISVPQCDLQDDMSAVSMESFGMAPESDPISEQTSAPNELPASFESSLEAADGLSVSISSIHKPNAVASLLEQNAGATPHILELISPRPDLEDSVSHLNNKAQADTSNAVLTARILDSLGEEMRVRDALPRRFDNVSPIGVGKGFFETPTHAAGVMGFSDVPLSATAASSEVGVITETVSLGLSITGLKEPSETSSLSGNSGDDYDAKNRRMDGNKFENEVMKHAASSSDLGASHEADDKKFPVQVDSFPDFNFPFDVDEDDVSHQERYRSFDDGTPTIMGLFSSGADDHKTNFDGAASSSSSFVRGVERSRLPSLAAAAVGGCSRSVYRAKRLALLDRRGTMKGPPVHSLSPTGLMRMREPDDITSNGESSQPSPRRAYVAEVKLASLVRSYKTAPIGASRLPNSSSTANNMYPINEDARGAFKSLESPTTLRSQTAPITATPMIFLKGPMTDNVSKLPPIAYSPVKSNVSPCSELSIYSDRKVFSYLRVKISSASSGPFEAHERK